MIKLTDLTDGNIQEGNFTPEDVLRWRDQMHVMKEEISSLRYERAQAGQRAIRAESKGDSARHECKRLRCKQYEEEMGMRKVDRDYPSITPSQTQIDCGLQALQKEDRDRILKQVTKKATAHMVKRKLLK